MKLDSVLQFTEMLNTFRQVERVLYANGTDRFENDTEHSYNLAMLAWHIVTAEKLSLDLSRILEYALVHDLVEVYAGDTYIYSDDDDHLASKYARESDALQKLRQEFPMNENIFAVIERYEKREDAESRFVYALDKVQSVLQTYLDHGRIWKEKKITFDMLFESKKDKVALSPEIKPYFDELMLLLKKEERTLFL